MKTYKVQYTIKNFVAVDVHDNNLTEDESISSMHENNEAEHTPKLFSEEHNYKSEENNLEASDQENTETEKLFDQDVIEEDDFEIPAFLRKQKF